MSDLPIADYALLSDCHTSALANRTGSIEWLPFPRFDSPSLFSRILDDEGGHFSICPDQVVNVHRKYLEKTLCLQTLFQTAQGECLLEDLLAVGPNDTGHALGANAPHALIRRLSCTQGSARIQVEYAPRPEYGLITPFLRPFRGGISAHGGASVLFLSSPVSLDCTGTTGRATIRMKAGEEVFFVLEHRSTSEKPPLAWPLRKVRRFYEGTLHAWQSWSDNHQNYQGPWKDLVHQSGRVLQGLTYYPTGAIVAAPTTSLPETIRGVRNWDYRFTWIRDASFTLNALWVAACPDESYKFFNYLANAALSQVRRNPDIQIMYGIGGERDLSERELLHLSGWRNSRPVRIGNDAWKQKQIDVYGELLDAAYQMKDYFQKVDWSTLNFFSDLADAAAAHWQEKDQGIWEIRGPAQDFVYSKLMCWVALDRAIALAGLIGSSHRVPFWEKIREEIRSAILAHGWNENVGAFTQAFGSQTLDASNLMMPIVGFLPAGDPRMLSTIEAIERGLTDSRGLVYRYKAPDGLEGEEGSFLLCTFWLAHTLALAGRKEHAARVFERAIAFTNDVGLLSEQVDPCSGELIGNFPQAFSHIGLINAAWAISQAAPTEK